MSLVEELRGPMPMYHAEERAIRMKAAAEIARLQEAKRHFSALADAKGKENVALRAENERLRQVEEMARYVLEKFMKDEAQGYRSRDRQFAIELLGKFLAVEQT